jgi:radical SAM protein with 4Fe4S-binding SPASM domain
VTAKFSLTLETNGSLVRKSLFEHLSGNPCHIAVTLDGAKPDTHNKIRGSTKSWNHAIQALTAANGFTNVTTQITFNISKRSKSEVADIYELGRDLGVNRIKMNPVFCIKPQQTKNASEFYCEASDFIEIAERFVKVDNNKYPFDVHFALPPALLPEPLRFEPRQCHCCRVNHVLGILCDGSIRPCHGFLDHDAFQLGSIWDPYNLETILLRLSDLPGADPRQLRGVCARCALAPFCGGYCRAQACYDFADPLASNPLCQSTFDAGLFPPDLLIENLLGCQ